MSDSQLFTSSSVFWPILAGVAIILSNGFFVAVEFSLVTSRRMRLEDASERGSSAARLVLRMLEDPDRAIAAAQLGITASSILLGIVAEEPLIQIIGPVIEPIIGTLLSQAAAAAISAFIVLVILSFFHMVVGEQVPKLIAIRAPERAAQFTAPPMWAFARITAPFVWVVDSATALVLRLVGIRGGMGAHGSVASLEELKAVVKQSGQMGLIEAEEQEMVYRVFEFGDRVVREVMVPRSRMVSIERNDTIDDVIEIFRRHEHSRLPVYDEDFDHVIGIVQVKVLLALVVDRPEARGWRISEATTIQPVTMVPESRLVGDLFAEMRASHTSLAIVIDEFGGTAGLVTIEDLVEEIVGSIGDEGTTQPLLRRLADHAYEVDAQVSVDEVNEKLNLHLPESDRYDTVAGLILQELRHIPTVGQELTIHDYRLSILDLDGPRIAKVRIDELPGKQAATLSSE